MTIKKLLTVRKALEALRAEIRKIGFQTAGKENRFMDFMSDDDPATRAINKIDLLDDYEQTEIIVGDCIMTELFTDSSALEQIDDAQIKADSIFINNKVERLMVKFRLTRKEDRFQQ